ncbi:MAG: translation initiation factor eIF-2B [Candidatus Methylomirabilaceae bacterium]
MTWDSLLDKLAQDRTSGAQELTRLVSLLLSRYLREEKARKGAAEDLLLVTRRILDAQPAMAPIITVLNHLWLKLEQVGDSDAIRAAVAAELEGISLETELRLDRLAEACSDRLTEGSTILAFSFSSTVLRALLAAHEAGKGVRVICSEGRPASEGIRLAEALAAAGVPVDLCVDAALPSLVAEADAVLVGADAVLEAGVINKIGTYPLALAANATARPFYFAASLDKLLPPSLVPLLRIPDRPPEEIWEARHESLHVRNRYFEITPLSLITGLITEVGLWSRRKLRPALLKAPVSMALARLAQEAAAANTNPLNTQPSRGSDATDAI